LWFTFSEIDEETKIGEVSYALDCSVFSRCNWHFNIR